MNISFNEYFPQGDHAAILSRAFNTTEEYYRNLKRLLKIRRVKGHELVRIGGDNDGGYVMVDNFRGGGRHTRSVSPMKFRGTRTWLGAATTCTCMI